MKRFLFLNGPGRRKAATHFAFGDADSKAVGEGIPDQHLFNVTWSAEETPDGKLGDLVVEDVEYESTIWEEV
jgi:hypothetical protein